jgi:4-amino-4-deoxy-L-arabinose transferase-like glycosyltransferase
MSYRPRWRDAVIVFVVALAFRGIYLAEASRLPDFNLFYMDQEYHLEWARALLTGVWAPPYDILEGAPFFRAPLYPYFLSGLFRLFGVSTTAVRVVQMLMGSISCALAYAVGTRCFGRRAGFVGGLACSVYWVLAYFDGELLLPVLLVLLALSGFLLAFRAAERRSVSLAAASGLTFGLYAITRPNILLFLPFAVWWVAHVTKASGRRASAVLALVMALGCALPPVAVTVRNAFVGGDAAIVASQGGVNFYIGNNPRSDGLQAVVPGTRQTWWGGYLDTAEIAESELGRELKPTEVSGYWFGKAFGYMRDEPGDWLRLTLRKTLAFVGDPEPPNNEPYEARRSRFVSLRVVPLSFTTLLALFAVAIPLALRRRGRSQEGLDDAARGRLKLVIIFLVVYSLSVIAFFVTGRYRVPLVPFLAMGAGASLVAVWDGVRGRRWRDVAVVLVAACAIAIPLRVDYLGIRTVTSGFAEFTDAADMLETGDVDGAIKLFEEIRAGGSVSGPEVYQGLVRAYLARGNTSDGEALTAVIEEGLSRNPADPELLWHGMLSTFQRGQLDLAGDRVRRYLSVRPDDLRGMYIAVGVEVALGDTAAAMAMFRRAASAAPDDELVARMRAQIEAFTQDSPP